MKNKDDRVEQENDECLIEFEKKKKKDNSIEYANLTWKDESIKWRAQYRNAKINTNSIMKDVNVKLLKADIVFCCQILTNYYTFSPKPNHTKLHC